MFCCNLGVGGCLLTRKHLVIPLQPFSTGLGLQTLDYFNTICVYLCPYKHLFSQCLPYLFLSSSPLSFVLLECYRHSIIKQSVFAQTLQLVPPDELAVPLLAPPAAPEGEEREDGSQRETPEQDEGEEGEGTPAPPVPTPLPAPSPIPPHLRDAVKEQWEAIKASVEKLRAVERYRVVGISYRRSVQRWQKRTHV